MHFLLDSIDNISLKFKKVDDIPETSSLFVAARGSQQAFKKSKSCFVNVKHTSDNRTLRNIVEAFEGTVFIVEVTRLRTINTQRFRS
jgi:hypothetical protein